VEVYLHPYLALAKEMVQIFLIEFPVKKWNLDTYMLYNSLWLIRFQGFLRYEMKNTLPLLLYISHPAVLLTAIVITVKAVPVQHNYY
jgi:hypothetical protein